MPRISIQTDRGAQRMRCLESATPGLVVHHATGRWSHDWVVTHRASGKAVAGGHPTIDAALDTAKSLGAAGDWERSEADILADQPFRDRARSILGQGASHA